MKQIISSSILILVTLSLLSLEVPFGKEGVPNLFGASLRLAIAFLCLLLLKKVHKGEDCSMGTLGFTTTNLFKGSFVFGWFAIVLSLINIFANLPNMKTSPGIAIILGCVFFNFTVGFFEEVLMRGVVLNHLLIRWKKQKNSIRNAVLCSSILFGVAHLVNLMYLPQLKNTTLFQVVFAIFAEVFFAGVYLRSKNLWSVILLHSLFDISTDLWTYFTAGPAATKDITLMQAIPALAIALPFLLIGLWLIRKSKLKEIAIPKG
ncbi:MAG: CPBP family intramembrane glutamic endopeptidase [Anaerovoracaceae bacterium]